MREIKFRAWDKRHNQMVLWIDLADIPYARENFFHYTDKEQVFMQFTGLLDKSGVEIWESDILESNDKLRKYKVVYNNNAGAWYLEGLGEAWCDPIPRWDSFEVNGNIYENKEMLK